MKAPFNLSSAIEKATLVAAFLPLVFLVYPESVAASYNAQNSGEKALVFEVNSKQKTNQQLTLVTVSEVDGPATTEVQQPVVQAPAPKPADKPVVKAKTASATKETRVVSVVETYAGKVYSKAEVEQLIVNYSAQYGINSQTPLCIAWRESGYNQFSKNRGGSTASGVFQYLTSTWRYTDEGKAGLNVFDADANVKAAVKYMAMHKSTSPWTVRSMCPALSFTQ